MIRRRRRKPASAEYVFQHSIDLSSGVGFNLQETGGVVTYAYNTAVDLGRRLNTLTYAAYTAGAGWSNSGGQVALHTAGNTATLAHTAAVLAVGKTYALTTVITGRTAGTVTPTGGTAISATTVGQAITASGTALVYTPTTDFDGSLDLALVVLKQTNILASSVYAPGTNPLDGAVTGATPGTKGGGPIRYMWSFDGATNFDDIYSAELNSIFDPTKGTIMIAGRVFNAGVWTDGTDRYAVSLRVDANNNVSIRRSTTNGQLVATYEAGGTAKAVAVGSLSTLDIFTVAITWDMVADEMIVYYNGAKQGTTQTGHGTWVGNFPATQMTIGAISTTPSSVWHGDLAYAYLPTVANTAPEIARLDRSLRG